ncbi:MAG TPA: hypothetical protein VGJ03_12870 [Acidimicrobiales bacterium]|jgi:hypothetical protein
MLELAHRPATIRVAIASIAFVLFAGVVAVLTHHEGLSPGEARLQTDGSATVVGADGQQRTVHGTLLVHNGDVVEATRGAMKLDLPDGSTVEGRPPLTTDQADAQPTRVKVDQPVEVLAGDALVTTSKSTDVDADGNRVHLDRGAGNVAAARVSRSLAVVAGVYQGNVTLDSAGQQRTIPALRQLDVATLGRPAAAPRALHVTSGDPWDRRFLGEAIDVGSTLDNYVRGYSSTLTPGDGRTIGFYQGLLPALSKQTDFTASMLDNERVSNPGDTLVGAVIATLGQRNGFTQRWNDVFAFHDDGAGWGLVALDQGVASDPLLQAVQNALNATPLQFAAAVRASSGSIGTGATGGAGTAATGGGSTASTPLSSSSSPGSPSSSGGGGTPATTVPPVTSPPPVTTPPLPTLPLLPPPPPSGQQSPPPPGQQSPLGALAQGLGQTVNSLGGLLTTPN